MNVLLLAPQPFFRERGTPIAVDLVLRGLSERGESVDVVTYPMGAEVSYPNVRIRRIPSLPFIRDVPPGFSSRKLVYDLLMLFAVFPLVLRRRYDLVHAVEESAFIALLLKFLFRLPYVYDMDSSLPQQLIDRHPHLFKPFQFLLVRMERLVIRNAKAIVPVCEALSVEAEKFSPEKVVLLRDVSLLAPVDGMEVDDLRLSLGIEGPLMLYVGNLELYQGIDLLMESFALALRNRSRASLVVIGGTPQAIEKYKAMSRQLGTQDQVHFVGPKPVQHLAAYLAQADILVSPRVKGTNTPMKIYSYLDSGKALLATRLPTHTQVLTEDVAVLADPTPRTFSHGVQRLLEDRGLRHRLGQAGKELVATQYSIPVFHASLNALYDWLSVELAAPEQLQAPGSSPRKTSLW